MYPDSKQFLRMMDVCSRLFWENENMLIHSSCLLELRENGIHHLVSDLPHFSSAMLSDDSNNQQPEVETKEDGEFVMVSTTSSTDTDYENLDWKKSSYWSTSTTTSNNEETISDQLLSRSDISSILLLSLLSIPSSSSSSSSILAKDETLYLQKKCQLLSLRLGLKFSSPSRNTLISSLIGDGILGEVNEQVRGIFNLLEDNGFQDDPLHLIERSVPLLNALESDSDHLFDIYIPYLKKAFLTRFLSQISFSFNQISISFLQGLVGPLEMEWTDVERVLMMDVAKGGSSKLRIDHQNGFIEFGESSSSTTSNNTTRKGNTTTPSVADPLVDLSSELLSACELVGIELYGLSQEEKSQFIAMALRDTSEDKTQVHSRIYAIHQRNSNMEKEKMIQRRKEREEREAMEKIRAAEEAKRQKEEREKRQQEKHRREKHLRHTIRALEYLERFDSKKDQDEVNALNRRERMELLNTTKEMYYESIQKTIQSKSDRVRKVDYMVRTIRTASYPMIEQSQNQKIDEFHRLYEEKMAIFQEDAESKKNEMDSLATRLNRMDPFREEYEIPIVTDQQESHDNYLVDLESRIMQHVNEKIMRAREKKVKKELKEKKEKERAEAKRQEYLKAQEERKNKSQSQEEDDEGEWQTQRRPGQRSDHQRDEERDLDWGEKKKQPTPMQQPMDKRGDPKPEVDWGQRGKKAPAPRDQDPERPKRETGKWEKESRQQQDQTTSDSKPDSNDKWGNMFGKSKGTPPQKQSSSKSSTSSDFPSRGSKKSTPNRTSVGGSKKRDVGKW